MYNFVQKTNAAEQFDGALYQLCNWKFSRSFHLNIRLR